MQNKLIFSFVTFREFRFDILQQKVLLKKMSYKSDPDNIGEQLLSVVNNINYSYSIIYC